MKLIFILNNAWKFRTDWRNIYAPADHKLILVTSNAGVNKLAADQKACFESILIIENFTTSAITHLIQTYYTTNYPDNSEIMSQAKVATTDERLTLIAEEVTNNLFNTQNPVHIIEKFRNKITMKNALKNSPIRIPQFIQFENAAFKADKEAYLNYVETKLAYPIFVKPTDAGGSRGVSVIKDRNELNTWCAKNVTFDNYEFDELIQGNYYHTDSIMINGQIAKIFVCKHPVANDIALREKIPLGNIVLHEDDPMAKKLAQFTQDVLQALNPVPQNCVFDLDLFVQQDGIPVFIEIAARSPGGLMPEMYAKMLHGANIEEIYFKLQLGIPVTLQPEKDAYAAYLWVPKQEGVVTKLNTPKIESQLDITWHTQIGQQLTNAEGMSDVIASVLIWGTDYKQLEKDFASLSQFKFGDFSPKKSRSLSPLRTNNVFTPDQANDLSSVTSAATSLQHMTLGGSR